MTARIAVRVSEVSKRYEIDLVRTRFPTLRDHIMTLVRGALNPKRRSPGRQALWALKNVSLQVLEGEVVGIIGRNGAGKSTLLKILSRITDPTTGHAEIRGRVGSLLEVGTGFHPELSGRENIYLNGAILGMKKREIDRKFDEIVGFAEVERFLDTPVKRYSSGMAVRLAFAVAAHLEPEILIVDEVLAVGDVAFQKKCLGKMDEVAKAGRTVLMVSHNMAAIQTLCSRAVLLSEGRLVFDGAVSDAVREYLSSVGQLQMQPLDVRTDRAGGELLRFIGLEFLDPQTTAPLSALVSGQPVLIRIRFRNRLPRTVSSVGISIGFSTASGTHLFSCRSKAVGVSHDIPPGEGYADCLLERLMLKAGRYQINLFAERNGVGLDDIHEAGAMDVEMGDFYGSGLIPSPQFPGVLVDYVWRRQAAAETQMPELSTEAT